MAITPRIHTAVIPAAGQGTRMLPATKSVPKELLPILDRPALQLIIDEALGAGVDHLVIVTSHAKPAIENYFATDLGVESSLEKQGRGFWLSNYGVIAKMYEFLSPIRISLTVWGTQWPALVKPSEMRPSL